MIGPRTIENALRLMYWKQIPPEEQNEFISWYMNPETDGISWKKWKDPSIEHKTDKENEIITPSG